MSDSLYNFIKSFHQKEVNRHCPSPSTKQGILPQGGQETARQLSGARAGEGTHLWELAIVCIASTSATNVMCSLEKSYFANPLWPLIYSRRLSGTVCQAQSFSEATD